MYLVELDPALGPEAAPSPGARVHKRPPADTARERVPGTAGRTAAVVAPHQVLADGVAAAGAGQAVVLVLGALDVGVADEAVGAGAVLLVADGLALGVEAAGVGESAGVEAGPVPALLVGLAVSVLHALHRLALNLGRGSFKTTTQG